jgi:hypothetical protein
MKNLERQQAPVTLSPGPTEEQLDRENSVVVEILTQGRVDNVAKMVAQDAFRFYCQALQMTSARPTPKLFVGLRPDDKV